MRCLGKQGAETGSVDLITDLNLQVATYPSSKAIKQ